MPTSASSSLRKQFDYDSLETADAVFAQQQTIEIRSLMKRTAKDIVDIGQRLIAVKQRLGYGRFGPWLESEFSWNQKTAERFMSVAQSFCSEFDNLSISDLAPSALYILAAASTPEAARAEAIARARAGESITYKAAQAIKQKYIPPKRALQVERRADVKPAPQSEQQPKAQSPQPIATTAPHPEQTSSTIPLEPATASTTQPRQRATLSGPSLEIMAIRPKTASASAEELEVVAAPAEKLASRFVQPSTWWQLGEEHLLYCGDPASSRFRERLPERVALSLVFLPSRDVWPQAPATGTISTIALLTPYLQDQDCQLFWKMIEHSLMLYTEGDDPVVLSFLPDPSILLLTAQLNCRCFCAEPDPIKCEAAILAWREKGFRAKKVTSLRF